jgi:hypothetical protein
MARPALARPCFSAGKDEATLLLRPWHLGNWQQRDFILFSVCKMGPAQKKRLTTVRMVSVVFVFFLTAINILRGPSLERIVDTIRQSLLLESRVEQLGNFSIHVDWHPKRRSERFPSVEERVKLYMSNWYHPPCQNASIGKFAGKYQKSTITPNGSNESWPTLTISDPWVSASEKNMIIDSYVTPDRNMVLHRATIEDCARSVAQYNRQGKFITETRINRRWNLNTYCSEVVELMNVMDQLDREDSDTTPILAIFGDGEGLCVCAPGTFEIPLFAKYRAGTTKDYIAQVTGSNLRNESCLNDARPPLKTAYHQDVYSNRLSPILWKLNLVRHWNPLPGAMRADTPWDQKKDCAFWGGVITGKFQGNTDLELCLSNQRCRFVFEHANSKLIDARITNTRGLLKNSTINGTNVAKPSLGVDIIQQFKIIICFQGNDVSSGLKWMLQSQSVVLMPPPTRTSWAMEELLVPWIHYIPMFPNGSNAEERVQWALDNQKEAQRIAERATLFIYDMVYHPDAAKDDRQIKAEMARRYRALWH